MIFIIVSIIALSVYIYKRYIPVHGVKDLDNMTHTGQLTLLDLRDYNEAYTDPIPGALNIPIAYLQRFYIQIPNKDLHVIATNKLEKNIGIRLLRKKGFNILGYTLPTDAESQRNANKSIGGNSIELR